jgi:hypothetical protein
VRLFGIFSSGALKGIVEDATLCERERNFIAALVARYLRQSDKRSRASILYEEAHLHGTARDQLREKLRCAVREVLAFYVFAVVCSILYLDKPGVPESQTVLPAMFLAAIVGPSCWLAYPIIRFALAR